jgi:hypothetical protein
MAGLPGVELDVGRLPRRLRDAEGLHRFGVIVEQHLPDAAGERAQLGVVAADGVDVVAPRDGDAVLGALQLRLQGEEVLVRLELRIALDDDEQARQRRAQRRLILLEAP